MTGSRRVMKQGFTLIEVLVTSAIAAICVTTVLGVTFRLERQRQVFQRQYQDQHRVEFLREWIRNDLLKCSQLSAGSNELGLTGSLSTDPSGEPTLEPAAIRYTIDSRGFLYRYENSSGTSDRTLLWTGVQKLETATHGLSGTGLPVRVRLRLVGDDERTILDVTTMLVAGGLQ